MKKQEFVLTLHDKYTESFIYLFDVLPIVAFVCENEKEVSAQYREKKVYTLENFPKNDYESSVLIACKNKSKEDIIKYTNYGWKYGENFLFGIDYIQRKIVEDIKKRMRKTNIIWGVGVRGKEFLQNAKINDISISYCVDSDEKKIGTYIEEKRVFASEILKEERKEDVFVIITTDYSGDITCQLEKMGFVKWIDYIDYHWIDLGIVEQIEQAIVSPPITSWTCQDPFRGFRLTVSGDIYCCHRPAWIKKKIGNAFDEDFESVKNSIIYKAIQLSVINHNYVFCHADRCEMLIDEKKAISNDLKYKKTYTVVNCADFDDSCNLYCESCRDKITVSQSGKKQYLFDYFRNNLLKETDILMAAGNGEVFLSKYYNALLDTIELNEIKGIMILSNGILFNEKKMLEWSQKVNGNIGIAISVDAATEKTYRELRRGGNFSTLCKKLEKIAEIRKTKQVKFFNLIFVMQEKNYKEMVDFVKIAERLGVDAVNFIKIDNWGTYTDEQYEQICMYQKDGKPTEQLEKEIIKIQQLNSNVEILLNDCYAHRLFMYEKLGL